MIIINRIIVLLLVLFCCLSCATNDGVGVSNRGNMRIEENRLYVKAYVDGRDTLEFFFDTGCVPGVIMPDSIASRYFCMDSARSKIDGIATLQDGDKGFFSLCIALDSTEVNSKLVYVNNEAPLTLSLANFDNHRFWSINYDEMKLSILPETTVVDTMGAIVLGFEQLYGLIFVNMPMTFWGEGKTKSVNYKLLFDTGTPNAMVITDATTDLTDYIQNIRCVRDSHLLRFWMDSIIIEGTTLLKLEGDVIREGRSYERMFGNGAIGTVGLGIFKHFNTIIDMKSQIMILRPQLRNFNN